MSKLHLQNINVRPYHIDFHVYGGYFTKCGLDTNKFHARITVYSGEEPAFCKKCLKSKRETSLPKEKMK